MAILCMYSLHEVLPTDPYQVSSPETPRRQMPVHSFRLASIDALRSMNPRQPSNHWPRLNRWSTTARYIVRALEPGERDILLTVWRRISGWRIACLTIRLLSMPELRILISIMAFFMLVSTPSGKPSTASDAQVDDNEEQNDDHVGYCEDAHTCYKSQNLSKSNK